MLDAILMMSRACFSDVYPPEEQEAIRRLATWSGKVYEANEAVEYGAELQSSEVLVSSWGAPLVDETFLAKAPNLRIVLHGAGSIKGIATPAMWARGVRICSAWQGNAVPVSEYTLATIFLSLKHFWRHARTVREQRSFARTGVAPGTCGATVGLVSLGAVGRLVAQRLQAFELNVLAYEPFARPDIAAASGIELVSLEELFNRSDVVSLHTPWLPETVGLISGSLIARMRHGATLINTSRGAVIDEPQMIDVLEARPDLHAVLDVTYPEPPAPGSKLYDLPNVTLTPHIAGALGPERRRLGKMMVEELARFTGGEPLMYEITEHAARLMA